MSYVIGITGRSGSGKTTLVNKIEQDFGASKIAIHTMDNYYKPRPDQTKDDSGYLNFDLPTSFYREQYFSDLKLLVDGKNVKLKQYIFNCESQSKPLLISSAPIIIVEGLFIYYYEEIRNLLDLSVLINLDVRQSYQRRLLRDRKERNYSEEEINHRYYHHVEPAYQQFILPYKDDFDLVIDANHDSATADNLLLKEINRVLNLQELEI